MMPKSLDFNSSCKFCIYCHQIHSKFTVWQLYKKCRNVVIFSGFFFSIYYNFQQQYYIKYSSNYSFTQNITYNQQSFPDKGIIHCPLLSPLNPLSSTWRLQLVVPLIKDWFCNFNFKKKCLRSHHIYTVSHRIYTVAQYS